MKKLTYNDIKPYIANKLISEQSHPENSDLKIFNYTHDCQYARAWDEVTMQCRGLIMDTAIDEIIARPFPKFFNYDEHISMGGEIPNENPIITDKLDGSLGIMYTFNDKTWIATRGSFTSDQAAWATKWWRDNKGDEPYGNEFTHLLEIIYPENRIVVNYDFSGLIHLATLETATGKTVPYVLPIPHVGTLNPYLTVEYLKAMDPKNEEGVVLHYPVADLRLKIKYEGYVKLHKIMTGLSEIGIWEILKEKGIDSTPRDVIADVPDEFYQWLDTVFYRLKLEYYKIRDAADLQFAIIKKHLRPDSPRKDYADMIKKMDVPAIGFAMLDKKPTEQIIFKMIRPSGSNTYKQDVV